MLGNEMPYDSLKSVKNASELLVKLLGEDTDIKKIDLPIKVEHLVKKISGVNYLKNSSIEHWDKSGYIKVNRKSNRPSIDIWVNPADSERRQRFTLAHELGHLVYDVLPNIDNVDKDDLIEEVYDRGGRRTPREIRADKFAAQFLMPAELVRAEVSLIAQVLRKNKETMLIKDLVKKLAGKFLVSESSMEIRLKTLNIIKQ